MTNLRLFIFLIALLLAPLAALSQDATQTVQADRSTTVVQP